MKKKKNRKTISEKNYRELAKIDFWFPFCKTFRSGKQRMHKKKEDLSHAVQIKDSQCAASYAILDFPVIFHSNSGFRRVGRE